MKTIRQIMAIVGVLGLTAAATAFMNQQAGSMTNRQVSGEGKGFAVVELFTSEGCSSCPPADKLIDRIQQENPDKPVYVLAYHVDYWDHQGWKDRFGSADYSARQKMYAGWLNLETIYTPQIVVNGKTEFVGSDEPALRRSIAAAVQENNTLPLTLTSQFADGRIEVSYQTNAVASPTELVIALVQKHAESQVRAGENAGRMLPHVQIVRALTTLKLKEASGKATMSVPKDYAGQQWELIGMVQDKSNGAILSATKIIPAK